MLLPIGDTPNPRGTPYVNYSLMAVNVGVFLFISLPLMMARPDLADPLLIEYLRTMGVRGSVPVQEILEHVSAYDLFIFRYGFRPAAPSPTSLLTAMFLHAGWMHLAGNMLFLWIFGDNVEHRLGRVGYLLVYLAAGAAATLFFALFVPHSQIPLVGASGAISGVLGCYYVWFPRNRVKTFVFLFPFLMNTFLIPSRWVLGFYLLVDNLLPFLATAGRGAGVAHGAHIGGFLAGLAAASAVSRAPDLLSYLKFRGQVREEERAEGEDRSGAARIDRSLREQNLSRAAAEYLGLADRQERLAVPSSHLLAIGDHLLQKGDYRQALALFRRFIAERPADPHVDRAFLGAGKAMIHQPRSITAAYQYFLSALDTAQTREVAEEARMHLRAIERLGEE